MFFKKNLKSKRLWRRLVVFYGYIKENSPLGERTYEHGRTNYTLESHTEIIFSRCTTVTDRYIGYIIEVYLLDMRSKVVPRELSRP